MKKVAPGERYRDNGENLPQPRTDIHFSSLCIAAADRLAKDRVMVLSGFFDDETTDDIRLTARNRLVTGYPVRLSRIVLQKVLPESIPLPVVLKRQPHAPSVSRTASYSEGVGRALGMIEELNSLLYKAPSIADIYGHVPHKLTQVVFNRTPKGRWWFPVHQDSQRYRGLGFAAQTADTLWSVKASETVAGASDFTFRTHPRDLVVLRERAGDLEAPDDIGTGYEDFKEDGSLVHTGLNLSNRTRFTMNVFGVEPT